MNKLQFALLLKYGTMEEAAKAFGVTAKTLTKKTQCRNYKAGGCRFGYRGTARVDLLPVLLIQGGKAQAPPTRRGFPFLG